MSEPNESEPKQDLNDVKPSDKPLPDTEKPLEPNQDDKKESTNQEKQDKPNENKTDLKTESKTEEKISIKDEMNAILVVEQTLDFKKGIKFGKIIKPKPKNDEILIKVYCVAINPIDYKTAMKMIPIFKKTTPYIMGFDFSGIIIELGPNVNKKKYKIGDYVCGQNQENGSFAEYICCTQKRLGVINNKVNYDIAAAFPLVSCTSYQALFDHGKLTKDDKLLILGGSTSCGLIGIQLAKQCGCKNITVTSSREELCKKFGATEVVNYRKDKWFEKLKGKNFDICYDTIGEKDTWTKLKNVLKKKDARIMDISGGINEKKQIGVGGLIAAGASFAKKRLSRTFSSNIPIYSFVMQDSTKSLDKLIPMIEQNKLIITIDRDNKYKNGLYPFNYDGIQQMIEKLSNQKAKGKLVMKISDFDNVSNNDDNDESKEPENVDDNNDKIDENKDDKNDVVGNGISEKVEDAPVENAPVEDEPQK